MKKCLVLTSALCALCLTSSASGSVTVGAIDPGIAETNCSGPRDFVIPVVTSGNSYVVPGNGRVTSWSHNAAPGAGQTLALKIFRHPGGALFTAVAHDGPRPLIPSLVNTFAVSIPVSAGDIIGLSPGGGPNVACEFPGTSFEWAGPADMPLADGQTAAFTDGPPQIYAENVSAVFEPTNSFTLGGVKRKDNGTAIVTLNLPNAGEAVASGKGVKSSAAGATSAKAVGAGTATLKIKAKGKQLRKLNSTGKVTLKTTITYTPAGGSPSSQKIKIKLRKR